MILYVNEDHANTNDSEWNYVNMNDEGTHLGHYTNTYRSTSSPHQLLEEFDEIVMETKRIRKMSCGTNIEVKIN